MGAQDCDPSSTAASIDDSQPLLKQVGGRSKVVQPAPNPDGPAIDWTRFCIQASIAGLIGGLGVLAAAAAAAAAAAPAAVALGNPAARLTCPFCSWRT